MFDSDNPRRVFISDFEVKKPRKYRLADFNAAHSLSNRLYVFNSPEDAIRFLAVCGYTTYLRSRTWHNDSTHEHGTTVYYANAEGREASFCDSIPD